MSFQFPIADVRPFSSIQNFRLPLPDWPEPATGFSPQFVNYFGEATERKRDPDESWPDEIKFIKASRGFRFDRLETRSIDISKQAFRPKCAYRRLFCDGSAVVRVEIGISHNNKKYRLQPLSIEDILKIVRELSEMKTRVPNRIGGIKPKPILAQGKNLSNLYAHASMNRQVPNITEGYKLVETGDPMVLIELEPHEILDNVFSHNSDGFTLIDKNSVNRANALFLRLETSVGTMPTWIIQKGLASSSQLRSLRICLSRLHAEREVLDLVIKQIRRGRILRNPSEETISLTDSYFNERTKIVNRKKWSGIKQSEMIAAFDATNSIIRPAIQEQLIRRYDGGRLQVWNKVKAFQEQRQATKSIKVIRIEKGGTMKKTTVIVSGTSHNVNVNVADYISGVTNTVNNNISNSSSSDKIIELVKQMTSEIEKIASDIPPDQLKKIGKNIEALSGELASEEPDQKWYEVSIDGILDAAKAIGNIADPIIKIATELSALLLV